MRTGEIKKKAMIRAHRSKPSSGNLATPDHTQTLEFTSNLRRSIGVHAFLLEVLLHADL
jgi:hypothetical protein